MKLVINTPQLSLTSHYVHVEKVFPRGVDSSNKILQLDLLKWEDQSVFAGSHQHF